MSHLDHVQRKAQEQFERQSQCYGKGHILQNVEDVEKALKHIPAPRLGATALDVATGGGHTGLALARHGYKITLADLSPAMLEQARKAAEAQGFSVETRQHPAEEFPYAAESFDLVSCRVAAHHFSSPEKFLKETARVLRQGGSFLLIDGSVEDGQLEAEEWIHQVEILRDPSHHRFLTPGRWKALAEEAGLQVCHLELNPFKQPDLEWYFETAATPQANREKVRDLVAHAPESARQTFHITQENNTTIWWWRRLTLVAVKS